MTEQEKYYNYLLEISGYFPTFFLIVPIFLAIRNWKRLNKPLKYFFWYCFWLFFFNLLVIGFIRTTDQQYHFWRPYLDMFQIKNVFFSRIAFFLNDFINLGLCYLFLLQPNHKPSFRYLSIGLLCLVSLIVFCYIDGYQNFGTVGQNMRYVFIIAIVLLSFRKIFRENTTSRLSKNPFLGIGLGLLIPLLIGLIFSFSADSLVKTNLLLYFKLHIAANAVEVFCQIFFVFAFLQIKYLPLSRK